MLTDYFSHHHSTVSRAAQQQSDELQAALERERRLRLALKLVWQEKERWEAQLSHLRQERRAWEKRTAELKARADSADAGLTRAQDDAAKDSERAKAQLAKERRERKEAEEREKAAEAKAVEAEGRLKATERRLTIAEKKVKKLEDADALAQQQLAQLRKQLAAAPPAPSSSSSFSSASASSELATLQLKLSFYESGPSTLHSLALKDLSALATSLQSSLDRVKEEQERRKECKICLQDLASVVFLPCEHMVCCTSCNERMVGDECPVCRTHIARRIQTKG